VSRVTSVKLAPKNWKEDPQYVYIGRMRFYGKSTYFGNPFTVKAWGTRERAIQMFEINARNKLGNREFRDAVKALHGKTLVCHCHPEPCHGDILVKLAEELNGENT
jgi:hypothetical protein